MKGKYKMNEQDRIRILNMVKNGVITVEEAEKLLSAAGPTVEPSRQLSEEVAFKDNRGRKGKKFRIIVDAATEKTKAAKVNVSIPVSLIRTIGPVIVNNLSRDTKNELNKAGIDIIQIIQDIDSIIESGMEEDIVNVDTGEGDEKAKVRIYVE